LRRVSAQAPYVSILTDLADYPPHFWIERGQEQYFICGTPKAVQQARDLGHPAERIFATSGMILRPTFYELPSMDRAAERTALGLDPNVPTGVVLFGGHGAPVMANIVQSLQPLAGKLQLILLCGHNEKLAVRLRAGHGALRIHVEGFTKEVPRFMQMADFMIGKPGPGSISEAIHMGLPAIVQRNNWTLPQERYNADWLTEQRLGLVLSSFRDIDKAVGELLKPGALVEYRERAAKIQNRAIFEIPDILAGLLEARPKAG
jgi:UDP-N-acetylglucosamine:LPS N-acetylglucosamine transferase